MLRIPKVILAIAVSWIICAIITAAGGFPDDSKIPQYKARTDARIAVLKEAKWFRFPYPGQKEIENHQIYRFCFLFLTANNLVIVIYGQKQSRIRQECGLFVSICEYS